MNGETLIRVLAVWESCDISDGLTWRVHEQDVKVFALCNDLFWWATADLEEITEDDLPLLERCAADLRSVDAEYFLGELFASRQRGMRPQFPWGRTYIRDAQKYEGDTLAPAVRALFDATGPERDRKDEG